MKGVDQLLRFVSHFTPFPSPHLELSLSQVRVMQLLVAQQGAQLHLHLGVPALQRKGGWVGCNSGRLSRKLLLCVVQGPSEWEGV
jgi:hypothetical protein